MTAFFRDHCPVVCLRLDMTPAALLRTTIHELQHLTDEAFIRAGMPEALYEWRARTTAERLVALGEVR
jgi:hypothetical protein